MSTARKYIKKVVRMRRYLNREGLSGKNVLATERAIAKLQRWLEFYPNATDAQVRRFLQRSINEVEILLPGQRSTSYQSLHDQLNDILHGHNNNHD